MARSKKANNKTSGANLGFEATILTIYCANTPRGLWTPADSMTFSPDC